MPENKIEHSRETYDKAKDHSDQMVALFLDPESREPLSNDDRVGAMRAVTARKKLAQLYEQGEAEARALHREYERLCSNAEKANKELSHFKKNQLGS